MTTTSDLWDKLNNPEYRGAFVASQINISVPFQIRALMRSRGWTQDQLAAKTGMRQPSISGLMTPGKTRPNIETLRRLAEAFDCGLAVRFVPFSDLAQWSEKFDPDTFNVPDFEHDSWSASSFGASAVGMGVVWDNWPYHVANLWQEPSNRIGTTFENPLIPYHDSESLTYYDLASGSGNLVTEHPVFVQPTGAIDHATKGIHLIPKRPPTGATGVVKPLISQERISA